MIHIKSNIKYNDIFPKLLSVRLNKYKYVNMFTVKYKFSTFHTQKNKNGDSCYFRSTCTEPAL